MLGENKSKDGLYKIFKILHFFHLPLFRKLIGARYFNKGYTAYLKTLNSLLSPVHNSTLFSTRDHEGDGTHTLSTAGGNFVPGANVFGNGNGTAKGGSPKARLAAYKVC